jgi:alpha-galactosidase
MLLACLVGISRAATVNLTDLDLTKIQQDRGKPMVDTSSDKHPIGIGRTKYEHGIGARVSFQWYITLDGNADHFSCVVGVDDEIPADVKSKRFPIVFQVVGDDKMLFKSPPMLAGEPGKPVDVDLRGIKKLLLTALPVGAGTDDGHVDWANGSISFSGNPPTSSDPPTETEEILTPPPPATPKINCARVVGARPNHPLLFTVAATGVRPMSFTAEGLPEGLTLNATTGSITGKVANPGKYAVKLHATNSLGAGSRDLRIEIGDKIALTPQMGWNSWNCFATAVSDEKVRAAADAMVNSGLIDHGWTYINIDDCWEVKSNEPAAHRRNADGSIKTNRKFPDMKALADYVHNKGLRIGIYSSPGTSTCGGYTASYKYEEQDARQYAAWGFDYLKYDWCSYGEVANQIKRTPHPPSELKILQDPYTLMRSALDKQDRDILFSFCQYGWGSVWTWGEQTGGNSWRTTGDIVDSWGSMSGIGFQQNGHEKYAGPGHWNDPDMLVVGKVGWGPALHPTRLTPNEQYTHITLWSLLDAPLLIGCDMTQMDDFTHSLLTNDEVIAVNQDPLGRQAARVSQNDNNTEAWAKQLDDGSTAVGLFNRGEMPAVVTVNWSDLGLSGKHLVRDLWRQKDLGAFEEHYAVEVPRHGAAMIRLSAP